MENQTSDFDKSKNLPFFGTVASICQALGGAIILDEQEERYWGIVRNGFSPEIWSQLEIGTKLQFSDNGCGCVVHAKIIL